MRLPRFLKKTPLASRLRPWRRGGLEIHHIATGKGDSTLIIGPDGSSLMIDAGASSTPPPASLDIRPSADRRPGEWIGRYAPPALGRNR